MTVFQRLWSTEALFRPLKIWMKHLEPCDLGPCTTGAHVPRLPWGNSSEKNVILRFIWHVW